jgi:hypothetical protein
MNDLAVVEPAPQPAVKTIFTILGGTTIPECAAVVRAHCKEGARVELRRVKGGTEGPTGISVWLECGSLLAFMKTWKEIGHVPPDTAASLLPAADASATVVAHGSVKAVAPALPSAEHLDWIEKAATENKRARLGTIELLLNQANQLLNILLAGMAGAMAYGVKIFEPGPTPLAYGAATLAA